MIIYNELNYLFDFDLEKTFFEILKTTIKVTKQKFKEFEVNLVDEKEIQEINNAYRHKDAVTDVISFRFDDNQLYNPMHGEIYICIPKAIAQAQNYAHSVKREICFLFVHGLLHLLGYDHLNEEDEKVMFALQEEILNLLKIVR